MRMARSRSHRLCADLEATADDLASVRCRERRLDEHDVAVLVHGRDTDLVVAARHDERGGTSNYVTPADVERERLLRIGAFVLEFDDVLRRIGHGGPHDRERPDGTTDSSPARGSWSRPEARGRAPQSRGNAGRWWPFRSTSRCLGIVLENRGRFGLRRLEQELAQARDLRGASTSTTLRQRGESTLDVQAEVAQRFRRHHDFGVAVRRVALDADRRVLELADVFPAAPSARSAEYERRRSADLRQRAAIEW